MKVYLRKIFKKLLERSYFGALSIFSQNRLSLKLGVANPKWSGRN
jgi:hypothetical protein